MLEDFKQVKIVYLTTFSNGEERSRPMTNFNDDPYNRMWFPTYRDTKKVKDIEENPKVLITFPSSKEGEYYEIEGRAEFEKEEITTEKWRRWYLYWYPSQSKRFFSQGEDGIRIGLSSTSCLNPREYLSGGRNSSSFVLFPSTLYLSLAGFM